MCNTEILKSWKHFWVLNKFYFSSLMCGVDGVVWALVAGRGPLWGLFFLTQQGTKSLLKNLTSHWDIKATPTVMPRERYGSAAAMKEAYHLWFNFSFLTYLLLSISLFNFQCAVYLLLQSSEAISSLSHCYWPIFLLFIKLKRKLRDLGNLSK